MNLGLGLIAADQYYKAGDDRVLRDRARQRFDWEAQRAASEMSELPSASQARILANQLSAGRSQSGIDALPDTSAREAAQARIDRLLAEGRAQDAPNLVSAASANAAAAADDAKFNLEQLPVAQQLRSTQQALGLGTARAALDRQSDENATASNQAKIARDLSQFNVNDLPRAIGEKIRAGAINEAQAMPTVLATLGDLASSGDSAGIVKFVNDIAVSRDGPNARKIGGVAIENGNLVFKDAAGADIAQPNGMKMQIPVAKLQEMRDRMRKTEYKVVDDALVVMRDGRVVDSYRPPGSSAGSAKAGPMQRDVNYLMAEHGYDKQKALNLVTQSKNMSKEQFITKEVANRMTNAGETEEVAIAKLAAIYDKIQEIGRGNATSPAARSAPPATTPPEQLRPILGLPPAQ